MAIYIPTLTTHHFPVPPRRTSVSTARCNGIIDTTAAWFIRLGSSGHQERFLGRNWGSAHGDFMGFHADLMGFNADLIGFHGDLKEDFQSRSTSCIASSSARLPRSAKHIHWDDPLYQPPPKYLEGTTGSMGL